MISRNYMVYLTVTFFALLVGVQQNARAEIINQYSGIRVSHSSYGYGSYPDNYKMIWSINVPCNHFLTIEVKNFYTEVCCDFLKMHSGLEPNYNPNPMISYSGNHTRIYHQFADSTTLIFSTDGSVVNGGFTFEFSVSRSPNCPEEGRLPRRMDAEFRNWTGQVSHDSSFILTVQPVESDARANCRVQTACGGQTMTFSLQTLDGRVFKPTEGDISLLLCISRMQCTVHWRSESVEQQIHVPPSHSKSLRIELIKPETWLLTGMIQFLAVSDAACSSVRHLCEVRTANDRSLTAKPVNLQDSNIIQSQCPSSVVTQFSVLTQPWVTVGSVIACNLTNGQITRYRLPFEYLHKPVWNISLFTGKSNPISFSVSLKPAASVVGRCQVRSWCNGHYVVTNETDSLDSSRLLEVFEFHNAAATAEGAEVFCIREITCTFSAVGGQYLESSLTLPQINPKTARIELIKPELWSLTGMIQFRVVSDATCPSVRHQCELRTANGSFLPAQQSNQQASQPIEPQCLSNVTTQFSLVMPSWFTAADSVILCLLNNGSFVEQELPILSDNSRLTSPMERPLLLATSVTAALSLIATFVLASALAVQSDCWRNVRKARESPIPGIELTAQGANQQTEDATCDVYVDDTIMESQDVYVT